MIEEVRGVGIGSKCILILTEMIERVNLPEIDLKRSVKETAAAHVVICS